jgi:hypothetical protein
VITLPRTLLEETFSLLRDCGRGETECQVFWLAPIADPQTITDVAIPHHSASPYGVEVDDASLNALWLSLGDRHLSIRAQVHTHKGRAFHSPTDDAWPVVHTAGFISLVIPRFALGPIGLCNTFAAVIDGTGHWQPADPTSVIRVR